MTDKLEALISISLIVVRFYEIIILFFLQFFFVLVEVRELLFGRRTLCFLSIDQMFFFLSICLWWIFEALL